MGKWCLGRGSSGVGRGRVLGTVGRGGKVGMGYGGGIDCDVRRASR